jgi:hypothetical protein
MTSFKIKTFANSILQSTYYGEYQLLAKKSNNFLKWRAMIDSIGGTKQQP